MSKDEGEMLAGELVKDCACRNTTNATELFVWHQVKNNWFSLGRSLSLFLREAWGIPWRYTMRSKMSMWCFKQRQQNSEKEGDGESMTVWANILLNLRSPWPRADVTRNLLLGEKEGNSWILFWDFSVVWKFRKSLLVEKRMLLNFWRNEHLSWIRSRNLR